MCVSLSMERFCFEEGVLQFPGLVCTAVRFHPPFLTRLVRQASGVGLIGPIAEGFLVIFWAHVALP